MQTSRQATLRTIDPLSQAWYNTEAPRSDGPSPSGKAPGFGPGIRGFESLRPSQVIIVTSLLSAGNLFYHDFICDVCSITLSLGLYLF